MKSLILSFFVYGSAVASASTGPSLTLRQTTVKPINTTSGLVSGHASSNASAQVSEYLGIPYAQPPVGNLRFAPPVAYAGSSDINGTNFVSPPWLRTPRRHQRPPLIGKMNDNVFRPTNVLSRDSPVRP